MKNTSALLLLLSCFSIFSMQGMHKKWQELTEIKDLKERLQKLRVIVAKATNPQVTSEEEFTSFKSELENRLHRGNLPDLEMPNTLKIENGTASFSTWLSTVINRCDRPSEMQLCFIDESKWQEAIDKHKKDRQGHKARLIEVQSILGLKQQPPDSSDGTIFRTHPFKFIVTGLCLCIGLGLWHTLNEGKKNKPARPKGSNNK